MTDVLTDPRTDVVAEHAEEVEHAWCDACWEPGTPLLCGEPDYDGEECPDDCEHPKCSMCELAWQTHECDAEAVFGPGWRWEL